MSVKGKYVGTIEYNFEIDVEKVGNATPNESMANLRAVDWEEVIRETLKPSFEDHSDGIDATIKVTTQFLDMYEVTGEQDER